MRPSRDQIYLEMAELIGRRSTCPRRQVGCVITDSDGRVLSMGYNGVPTGAAHCNEGHLCPGAGEASGRGLDKCIAIHAEQNAILLLPDPRKAHTIYVTATPCVPCMKLLLGTSAERIVARELYPHPEAIGWWASAGRTIEILEKDET